MKKLFFIVALFSASSFIYCLDTVVERDGKRITSDVDSRGKETISVDFFQDNGVIARMRSVNGLYYIDLVISREYFVGIDDLSISLMASKELSSYSERYKGLTISATKNDFIDKAKDNGGRSPFVFSRELNNGLYITTFSAELPNYKASVVTYLKELKIHAMIGVDAIDISIPQESVRILQDFGLIIYGGLR